MVRNNNEYKRKIKLGKKVYKILGRTDIEQGSLTLDMKEAIDIISNHFFFFTGSTLEFLPKSQQYS